MSDSTTPAIKMEMKYPLNLLIAEEQKYMLAYFSHQSMYVWSTSMVRYLQY